MQVVAGHFRMDSTKTTCRGNAICKSSFSQLSGHLALQAVEQMSKQAPTL